MLNGVVAADGIAVDGTEQTWRDGLGTGLRGA
jgi:hypothetical protein